MSRSFSGAQQQITYTNGDAGGVVGPYRRTFWSQIEKSIHSIAKGIESSMMQKFENGNGTEKNFTSNAMGIIKIVLKFYEENPKCFSLI